jgi:negative regulator of flagellin synthesis FlgM
MSYASGVGSLQQEIVPISPSAAKTAIKVIAHDGAINVEPAANVQHADHTNLSSAGGLVAEALESPDTRSAKVASLQQAIAAGNYSVSSSDVADKIIQSLLD